MASWYVMGGDGPPERLDLDATAFEALVVAHYSGARLLPAAPGEPTPCFDMSAVFGAHVSVTWYDGMVSIDGPLPHAAELAVWLRAKLPGEDLVQIAHESLTQGTAVTRSDTPEDLLRRLGEGDG